MGAWRVDRQIFLQQLLETVLEVVTSLESRDCIKDSDCIRRERLYKMVETVLEGTDCIRRYCTGVIKGGRN